MGEKLEITSKVYLSLLDNLIYCEDCMDNHFKIIAESPDIEGYLADLEYHDIK